MIVCVNPCSLTAMFKKRKAQQEGERKEDGVSEKFCEEGKEAVQNGNRKDEDDGSFMVNRKNY